MPLGLLFNTGKDSLDYMLESENSGRPSIMVMHPISTNPSAGGKSGARSNITVYIFTHFDSLVNLPVPPALSPQAHAECALHSVTGSASF